jgi:hypothetical protein
MNWITQNGKAHIEVSSSLVLITETVCGRELERALVRREKREFDSPPENACGTCLKMFEHEMRGDEDGIPA